MNVAHARAVAAAFSAAGYRAVAVCGETHGAERDAAIGGLATGATQILCAADLVSEGLDIPRVECVLLLRPTASLTLYMQQVGRGLRWAEGKRLVILDHAGNAHRHGFPDDERSWSLEGKPKGGRKAPALKQCPSCYCVHRPAKACTECGFVYAEEAAKRGPRKSLKVVAGELEELCRGSGGAAAEARKRVEHIRKTHVWVLLEGVRRYEDLIEIAAAKGYKPGWVYRAAEQRGLLGRKAA